MYISKKNGITSSSIQLLSNITMVILPDKFYFEVTDIGTSFTVYVNGIFSSKKLGTDIQSDTKDKINCRL